MSCGDDTFSCRAAGAAPPLMVRQNVMLIEKVVKCSFIFIFGYETKNIVAA